ncbi:MAG: hypothetical protein ACXQTN_00940 [Methanoculleaceae archaeon]
MVPCIRLVDCMGNLLPNPYLQPSQPVNYPSDGRKGLLASATGLASTGSEGRR